MLYEPWWAESIITEIYRYKCQYDSKAISLMTPAPMKGVLMNCETTKSPTIPVLGLSQAIVSYFYSKIGEFRVSISFLGIKLLFNSAN